jgi:hypothetical protein
MPTYEEKLSKPTGFLFSLLTHQINGEKTWTSVQNYKETGAALIAKENSQAFD